MTRAQRRAEVRRGMSQRPALGDQLGSPASRRAAFDSNLESAPPGSVAAFLWSMGRVASDLRSGETAYG